MLKHKININNIINIPNSILPLMDRHDMKSHNPNIFLFHTIQTNLDINQTIKWRINLDSIWKIMSRINFKDELKRDLSGKFGQWTDAQNKIDNALNWILNAKTSLEEEGKAALGLDLTSIAEWAQKWIAN